MKTEILGLNFDALTMQQAQEAAMSLIEKGNGGYIVTANPEIMLEAQKNGAYREAINAADLVLADGIGDLYVARILGKKLPERVAGSDIVPRLFDRLAARGGSVFLYGAKPGVAAKAGRALEEAYPGLRIVGTENGYITDETALWGMLDASNPDLLLLGLGAPRQELWMAANRSRTSAVMPAGCLCRRRRQSAGGMATGRSGMALSYNPAAEADQTDHKDPICPDIGHERTDACGRRRCGGKRGIKAWMPLRKGKRRSLFPDTTDIGTWETTRSWK